MPPVVTGGNIKDWLLEMRVSGQGINGPIPLSFQEIKSWRDVTETSLSSEESLLLAHLSDVYCSQYYESSELNCPAPYHHVDVNQDKSIAGQFMLDTLTRVAALGDSPR